MRRIVLVGTILFVGLLSVVAAQEGTANPPGAGPAASPRLSDVTPQEDPYLWLEDVLGEKALAWVEERNAATKQAFESDPAFTQLRDDLLAIFDSNERIPVIQKRGEWYYNFWRDKEHVRGIWRRTTLDEYRKSEPKWEVVLDLDALAEAEKENWVWSGAQPLKPDYNLWLVSLSRGGADATVTREFDVTARSFVEGGFYRPEAKGQLSWIDRDTVFVATDFGPGSMTESGYPRTARRWRRGTPMESAEMIYEGRPADMRVMAVHDDTPGFERNLVLRQIAFYADEAYLLADDGTLTKIDAPDSAEKQLVREWLILELREPWEVEGRMYPAGSLLAARFDAYLAGNRKVDVLFEPTDTISLAGYSPTLDHLVLNVLDDVKNRLYVLTHEEGGWRREPLRGAPEIGTVSAMPVDPDESNAVFLTVADYVTPTSLLYGEIGGDPERLKQLPAFFDSTGLKITQHFAKSADGTRIPYFQVSRDELELDGSNPTLLYGYGGFEISLTPSYNASVGRAWLSQGGVYVVANIRGGGEYGPRWHQSALKARRLQAYEDFAAVAEDVVSRGVTSVPHLGIQGGSNGGLLVGNMFVRYPGLFAAAVCQVPLLDMKRYHRLLAGASWMAEYGDPDDASEWDFIRTYSPYQNVSAGVTYPSVLFTTSTRDDRVHPGHARKMMARMMEQGHDVTYYENVEGGHGGSANNIQAAYMQALAYRFLQRKLFPAIAEP
jgi:prolyl oligopeptidase